MRTYESIFIVHPDVSGDAYTAVVDKFKGILEKQDAELLKVDEWGTRTLAYPVEKQNRGSYVQLVFKAPPKVPAEFERRMRLDDAVIKFQTIELKGGLKQAPAPAEEKSEAAAESAEPTS